jgi:hypothetical protein
MAPRIMRVPPPEFLPAFPDAIRVRPKTAVKRGGGMRKRWKLPDGRILEWDSLHGRLEVYNASGRHLGEWAPTTGRQISGPKHRKVEP